MKKFTHIRKRDGRLQSFQRKKITAAIDAALKEVGMADHALADALSRETVDHLQAKNFAKVIDLEKVQDAVEHVLVRKDLTDAAKAYILYRQRHAEARLVKRILGVEDELKLSLNAIRVLERRYLAKDTHGRIVESPLGMFQRVARAVAEPD